MSREELRVAGLPEPISHFTDAVRAGNLLFISGVIPVDEHGELVGGDDVVAQAEQVFRLIDLVLAAAGAERRDVVKVTVYLTDIGDRALVNPVRQAWFGDSRPASTLVEVGALVVPGACIEVEAIALLEAVTAAEIAAGVASGALRAEDVVATAIDALRGRPELNAVITICEEPALARARAGVTGRLAGVPLLVKDLIDTAGVRTTYASAIYRDHVPERSAGAVLALEAEGAIVVAKANADEFAWGVTGQNEHYGDAGNPRHPGRIAGGSSGGNAAALAAGLVPLALGTDTGGSVRLPAAACGVVGLKPALGAVPVDGVFPLAASFDTVGPMATTVADCALAHAILTRTPVPRPRIAGLRAGVLRRPPRLGGSPDAAPVDDRAAPLAERLRRAGALVRDVELPVPEHDVWPVFYADAAAAHGATYPSRRDEYGTTVRAKLDTAIRVDPEEVRRARASLARWRTTAATEPDIDVIVSPVLGLAELPLAGVDELDVRIAFSAYTRPFSYLGWPAIAIGGLQLAGRDGAVVIAAALAIEGAGRE